MQHAALFIRIQHERHIQRFQFFVDNNGSPTLCLVLVCCVFVTSTISIWYVLLNLVILIRIGLRIYGFTAGLLSKSELGYAWGSRINIDISTSFFLSDFIELVTLIGWCFLLLHHGVEERFCSIIPIDWWNWLVFRCLLCIAHSLFNQRN